MITNSAEYGLIPQRDFFDKDIAVEGNTSNYYIVKKGDFVYNPRKSTTAPYGPFNCYRLVEEGIVSPLYTCLTPKHNEYTEFLLWYFKSPAWYSYIYHNGAQGGARHDRVGMTNELMDGIPVNLPCLKEQEKISIFLSTLDNRIDAQCKLVDALKSYKRGLLKQILAGIIRVIDRPFIDWKKYRLRDICICLDRQRVPVAASNRKTGKYPYYGANGIQGHIDSFIFDGEFVLLAEDGGHFNDYETEPLAQYVSGKIWVNNHAHVLKTDISTKFLYYSLVHRDIRDYINNPSRGKLNQEDMMEIEIDVPERDEQEKIVEIIDKIQDIIHDNTLILEALEHSKQALLHQMFI